MSTDTPSEDGWYWARWNEGDDFVPTMFVDGGSAWKLTPYGTPVAREPSKIHEWGARLLAAQVPRPVPEGDRTKAPPRWRYYPPVPMADTGDYTEEFWSPDGLAAARSIEEAWGINDAIAADATAPLAARIEALEAERDGLQEAALEERRVVLGRVDALEAECARLRGLDSQVSHVLAILRDADVEPEDGESLGGSVELLVEQRDEARSDAAGLADAIDKQLDDSGVQAEVDRRLAAQSTPRPTVDSGAPSGPDTSKPAPGKGVATGYNPASGAYDAWYVWLGAHRYPAAFATEAEAIAESHRIYAAESAPAVAAATATLVAERDALRVRLAEVELLRDHAMQDAAAQRVLGYGLGGAITRDQLANAATYLYGPSEAARLFPAGPRAETSGEEGAT